MDRKLQANTTKFRGENEEERTERKRGNIEYNRRSERYDKQRRKSVARKKKLRRRVGYVQRRTNKNTF